MDWTKPTAMLLGRYQPWHKGHRKLLKRALSKTGQVVILLRESDGTDNNPYTIEQRIDFIKDAFDTGLVDGITTNPSLMLKNGHDPVTVIKQISEIFPFHSSISAEVVGETTLLNWLM